MRDALADEVKSTIGGRSDHQVAVVEQRESALELVRGQMGAVAVEDHHPIGSVGEEDTERRIEGRGQAVPLLRDDLDGSTEPGSQLVYIPARANERDGCVGKRARELERILDETAKERQERGGGEEGRETLLHVTGPRCLRAHDQTAPRSRPHAHRPRRRRYLTMPEMMHQPAPIVPLTVPVIFDRPMRGW